MAGGVTYRLVDSWNSGFNAAVGITAPGDGLNGWVLVFEADFTITQIWNAEIVSHVGNRYEIRNAAWNGTVPANGQVEFGFLGSATADPYPDSFTLNGATTGEALPEITVSDATVTEADEGKSWFSFYIRLSEASDEVITLRYSTEDGTAIAGSDYVAASKTVTFQPGETEKKIGIAALGDTIAEANETLRLRLSDATGATIADDLGIGTIRDNDAPPSLKVNDIAFNEGDSGTTTALFTVKLSKAWREAVTVAYATADGKALAGIDYTATQGSLTFAAGETSKTVAVAVHGDLTVENNENLLLILSNAIGATIADDTGSAIIRDDDRPPALSVSDTTVTEGDAGSGHALFTITLSKAWDETVSVHYATANGTALAGQDYAAAAGTLTFAPGQVSKTISIAVSGDLAAEADETFSLVVTNPTGATIKDATGVATILDDDSLAAPGFLSTEGNQIVDSNGDAVRITGVNWFGMETSNNSPHGLWARNWSDMMDQMADLGFNTIRLPFSLDALKPGAMPNGINYALNPDLAGLSSIQILDRIVDHAGELGMRIVLDNHRSAAGNGPNGNGLWVDGGYTEQQWIDSWTMLADRYAGNPTIIGADLANEPHNGVWGGGGANDWTAAAERAGNAIHAVNENWLIFVEGVGNYNGQSYWWGGNLQGVAFDPVVLNTPNKLVYSPHDYGNSVYGQSWFQDPAYPANLPAVFDDNWGYVFREEIAPVMVGEFGTKLIDPKDGPWLDALLAYMDGDFNNDGTRDIAAGDEGISFTWWSWNPNSGDTGGILADDWTTPIAEKIALLQPHLSDMWE